MGCKMFWKNSRKALDSIDFLQIHEEHIVRNLAKIFKPFVRICLNPTVSTIYRLLVLNTPLYGAISAST